MPPGHPRERQPRPEVIQPSRTNAPDEELLEASHTGDAAAFGELVGRHSETVYALVRRYAGSTSEARDLAQRTFLQAYAAARRGFPFRPQGPFRAWLLRIALNVGKNHARQLRRWRGESLEGADDAAAPGPTPLEAALQAERERLVRAAVLALSRRQREVFTLRIDAGLAFSEVAAVLGISVNGAKVHFHGAVSRLRQAVATLVKEGCDR